MKVGGISLWHLFKQHLIFQRAISSTEILGGTQLNNMLSLAIAIFVHIRFTSVHNVIRTLIM